MKRLTALYRDAYTGMSPAAWWLSAIMLINRAGTMVMPFMTLYLTQHAGYTIAQAGMVMAAFGAGAVCGGFIGGKLTDKFGFYYIQISALAGGGILFIILGQMESLPMICLFSFLLSTVNDSFRPANAAAIAYYSNKTNRTRSFSLNRLAINLGWACGGALGGFIASRSYELLFMIDGLSNIGAAFLLWIYFAPSKRKPAQTQDSPKRKTGTALPAPSPYKDKPYLFFLLLSVLFAACFFQLFTTLPVYYREQLGLTEQTIGVVMALNGVLIALFEMVVIHRLEGHRPILFYIAVGVCMMGASFVIFNLFPGGMALAIIAAIIMSFGEMGCMAFMNTYWIERATDGNRGQYAGLYTISWSIAQVAGPATGAQVADRLGFPILWWMVGTICLLCTMGFLMLLRNQTAEKSSML